MREIREILRELKNRENASEYLAMATLVQVEGSAYRRPGARMLILPDGRRIGSLSGGCLEADVAERARKVLETGEPRLVCYDGRSGFDPVVEMGCQGTVGILIERIRPTDSFLRFLADCFEQRSSGVLATVYHTVGETDIPVGTHLACCRDTVLSERDNGDLRAAIAADAVCVLQNGQSQNRIYSVKGGSVHVLLEAVQPPTALLLFGAGQDAVPLAQFAAGLGWQVTLLDYRPALLTPERFPADTRSFLLNSASLPAPVRPDEHTAAVLMTHNYAWDRILLQTVLSTSARYIGLLGPRRRAERLLAELQEDGVFLPDSQEERLHSPVGLDLGSETPEEIALSIISEIQMTLRGRTGVSLREQKRPIHAATFPASHRGRHAEERAEWTADSVTSCALQAL